MRLNHPVRGALAAATFAGALVACAAISGLGAYSASDCPAEGCDASVVHPSGEETFDGLAEAMEAVEAGDEPDADDSGVPEGGSEGDANAASDAPAPDAPNDAGPPCPDGGCPRSTATGFSCPFGHCNGSTSECSKGGGCFCSNDMQCISGKCVKVTGENDVSCGSNCTGSGGRDGFDCELQTPGIPALATAGYSCPTGSGFGGTTLSCDSTFTNCYCNVDAQCPSGHCIPSVANNANCASAGPCTGVGTPDYRGCQPTVATGTCPAYLGCPTNTTCQYPTCYCSADVACASGHCIPSFNPLNCSGCTGAGTDDGHGCEPAPSSVPCMGSGGTACTTTLIPAPVPNSGRTACLCVSDTNCSSGKCVNANNQCTGTCLVMGPKDSENCETATSVANGWSCSIGNCSNVTAPGGQCTAAGVPCWCTSDSQCPSGGKCAGWSGCAPGACTGDGNGNGFHCVP